MKDSQFNTLIDRLFDLDRDNPWLGSTVEPDAELYDKSAEDEFISQCMSDLKDKFPDEKQRYAVCKSKWDRGDTHYDDEAFDGHNSKHMDTRPGIADYAGKPRALAINRALRANDPLRLWWYRKEIRELTDTIEQAPCLDFQTVYRVGRVNYSPGTVFSDPAFVSTTQSKEVASIYAKTAGMTWDDVVHIVVPAGTKGVVVQDSNEKEVILQRGTKFRVLAPNRWLVE